MIFQEPMSALNPVFTIGDQITEIFLLHELPDLIQGTIRKLDENYAALSSTGYTATRKIEERRRTEMFGLWLHRSAGNHEMSLLWRQLQ